MRTGKDFDAGKDWGQEDRGWDGWMASLTQWTWVWTNSRRWWRAGKPRVLQSSWLQRAGHYWVTEQQGQFAFSKMHPFSCPVLWLLKHSHVTITRSRYRKSCNPIDFLGSFRSQILPHPTYSQHPWICFPSFKASPGWCISEVTHCTASGSSFFHSA